MKYGDYVRTKRGYIAKFKQYLENTGTYMFDNVIQDINGDKYKCISENELKKVMVKHSKDIKELVQVGDYVNGRKVYQVGYNFQDDFVIKFSRSSYEDFIYPNEIKEILTKEMYNQNLFKVVE